MTQEERPDFTDYCDVWLHLKLVAITTIWTNQTARSYSTQIKK